MRARGGGSRLPRPRESCPLPSAPRRAASPVARREPLTWPPVLSGDASGTEGSATHTSQLRPPRTGPSGSTVRCGSGGAWLQALPHPTAPQNPLRGGAPTPWPRRTSGQVSVTFPQQGREGHRGQVYAPQAYQAGAHQVGTRWVGGGPGSPCHYPRLILRFQKRPGWSASAAPSPPHRAHNSQELTVCKPESGILRKALERRNPARGHSDAGALRAHRPL